MEKKDMDDLIAREMEKVNRVARKINRARGYDDPAIVAKHIEKKDKFFAMLRRVLKPDASFGDFYKLLATRFSGLTSFVKKVSAQAPSIKRFESVIKAMIEVMMESIGKQDQLFMLSHSFYLCFDLLIERPKTVKNLTSIKDIYFTDSEKKRLVKSIVEFFDVFLATEQGSQYDETITEKQIPEKFVKKAQRYCLLDDKLITDQKKTAVMCDIFFHSATDGLWEWDGDLFRYLQPFFCDEDCFNFDRIVKKFPKWLLSMPCVKAVEVFFDNDYGVALTGATLTEFTNHKMSNALVDDVEREINNEVSRSEIAELERRVSDNRRTAEDLLKQLKLLGKELPPNSDKIKHVDDAIRRTEKCMRDMDECDYMLEQRKAEILPPREVAQKEKPIEEPPAVYRGCEKVYSKFYGQTLGQSIGKKIKVDRSGIIFSCPTTIAVGKVAERSYKIKGKKQLEFLDQLLASYKKNENAWVWPVKKSSIWRPGCFNSGDSKRFFDDGHIENERNDNGIYTGRIKLSVPGKPKKRN